MFMEDGSWMAQLRAEIIMRLMTSLRVAHDNCPSDVLWHTLTRTRVNERFVRAPTTGSTTTGPLDATIGVTEAEVATENPTGAQEEKVAPTAAAAWIAAPTAAPGAEEEAREVMTTLGAADPPEGGVTGRADTTPPRATATEGTESTLR